MKIRAYIFVVVVLVLFLGPQAWADSTSNREYQIKAAFLYNFIMFVDWPKEKIDDGNEPITIAIIGKDPFKEAFEPLKDKKAKGRNVLIKRINGIEELEKFDQENKYEQHPQIETIRKSHLLFVCASEKKYIAKIIDLVKDHNILTVSETEGFLEAGGIINFLMQDNKVCFEINLSAAKHAKLQIRSKLLRLAKRVID